MDLLKNIPIGIDTRKDGIQFNLNLFSKGTAPNYHDSFPMTIVRTTGARIEIVNNAFDELCISNVYLGIILEDKIVEAYASSYFFDFSIQTKIGRNENFEIAFEGKELISIFDNHKKERGVILIENTNYTAMSNCFDGDLIEQELERLNNDTDPEYQNWHVKGYQRLDLKYENDQLPKNLKGLKF